MPAAERSHLPHRTAGIALLSLLVLATAAGCGISFGADDASTEIFTSIELQGDLRPGETATLVLAYEQPYPVTVNVACDVLALDRSGTETPVPTDTPTARPAATPTLPPIPPPRPTPVSRVVEVVVAEIAPNPTGGPIEEVTPVPGTLEGRFRVPEPGRYLARCFTPGDPNNTLVKEFSVSE